MVMWLRRGKRFPDPELEADEHGLVAIGGEIVPDLLVEAYRRGIFPWSSDPVPTWWCPHPRAIFPLDAWRPHRSILRSIRREGWTFTTDRAFVDVMLGCAEASARRPETWITEDFVNAYAELHRHGIAHSLEVWEGDALVGGIYGVTLGGYFGGESMFHRRTDASKAAVTKLAEHLRERRFTLFDAQVMNPHLARLGAVSIGRTDFLRRLKHAISVDASF